MPRATASKQSALLPVDQGRKRRGPNADNLDLLTIGKNVLAKLGGEAWLLKFATAHPKEFVAFLARLAPFQLKADVANLEIHVTRIEAGDTPIAGVLKSPLPQHVMQLVHDANVAEHEHGAAQG